MANRKKSVLAGRIVNEAQKFLRAVDVAVLCGVSESTVRNWRRSGILPEPRSLANKTAFWDRDDIMKALGR